MSVEYENLIYGSYKTLIYSIVTFALDTKILTIFF